jgi:hypothetical protein
VSASNSARCREISPNSTSITGWIELTRGDQPADTRESKNFRVAEPINEICFVTSWVIEICRSGGAKTDLNNPPTAEEGENA